jgi:hypothetical protein
MLSTLSTQQGEASVSHRTAKDTSGHCTVGPTQYLGMREMGGSAGSGLGSLAAGHLVRFCADGRMSGGLAQLAVRLLPFDQQRNYDPTLRAA